MAVMNQTDTGSTYFEAVRSHVALWNVPKAQQKVQRG